MARRTCLATLGLALLLLWPAASQAQNAKPAAPAAAVQPPVIAVVDIKKVLSSADASLKAKKAIDARRAIYERELDQHKQGLKTQREALRVALFELCLCLCGQSVRLLEFLIDLPLLRLE